MMIVPSSQFDMCMHCIRDYPLVNGRNKGICPDCISRGHSADIDQSRHNCPVCNANLNDRLRAIIGRLRKGISR